MSTYSSEINITVIFEALKIRFHQLTLDAPLPNTGERALWETKLMHTQRVLSRHLARFSFEEKEYLLGRLLHVLIFHCVPPEMSIILDMAKVNPPSRQYLIENEPAPAANMWTSGPPYSPYYPPTYPPTYHQFSPDPRIWGQDHNTQ